MKVLQFLLLPGLQLARGRLGREAAGWSRLPLAESMKSPGQLLQSPSRVPKSPGWVRLLHPRVAYRIPCAGCWGPQVRSDYFRRSRHKDGIRLWRWLDRRLEEALQGDAVWYCLTSGTDSCQGICLLIVISWHMEKLASFKVSTELHPCCPSRPTTVGPPNQSHRNISLGLSSSP